MKPIQKDELYEHLHEFLKNKGVELKDGSYAQTIQKSCSILADAINLGQRGIEKAKTEIDQKLDQVRQAIHEKTAPPTQTTRNPKAPSSASPPNASPVSDPVTARSAKPRTKAKKASPRKPAQRAKR